MISQLKALTLIIWLPIITCLIVFYALVGALTLHHVKPVDTFSSTCDAIVREDNILWCKAVMNSEDDNMTIVRGVE